MESLCHPSLEGAALWRLCERGVMNVEYVRRLIAVTAGEERCLRKTFGAVAASCAVRYRIRVLRHFEALLRKAR